MTTILVVEDEVALRETLVYNLQKQNYTVEAVGDGEAAVQAARRLGHNLDLIVLDLMLPKLDGYEVCRILRQETGIPILMLSARDDEIDRVVGLEIGADDYITKPFSMRELMARVKSHLRREQRHRDETTSTQAGEVIQNLQFGNLLIDLTRREILLDGNSLALQPREFDLMLYMAKRRGYALSREQLLEQVWGWDYVGSTRTVDVHIHGLREKIEPDRIHPQRIVTVRGSGYRFEG